MQMFAALLAVAGVSAVSAAPQTACTPDVVFVADDGDLCRYHWCVEGYDSPIEWRCPPGSRVPTWFRTSPTEDVIPCTEDHSTDTSCLRCDYNDERAQVAPSLCSSNPCPSNCECQDLWQSYHCLCPGDEVPTFITVDRETFFCDSNPCRNGAECFSQWDDYWCQCPRGYTGKNCEVPLCEPNPCQNGGTCTIDDINYSCECRQCFGGSCCESQISGGDCERAIVPPPTAVPPTTKRPDCAPCLFGDNCQFTRLELCDCNPCQPTQLCYGSVSPGVRQCLGKDGPYGSQYTLTFSQDSNGGSSYKRVYVNVGGEDLTGSRRVRIYTPGITNPADKCYVDMTVSVSLNQPTFYDVPGECLNTESGQVEDGKVLRVVEVNGVEIAVTVANMDGDGYLAIPDAYSGQYYVAHTNSKSGSRQYISIVALNDETKVSIQKPDEEIFSFGASPASTSPTSNIVTFSLSAMQSVRYSYPNLAGSVIVSNGTIHVWSGNLDDNSQKTEEQLPTVNRWGAGSSQYRYVIVSAGDRNIDTFDDVHVQSAVQTSYVLVRITASGQRMNLTVNGLFGANSNSYLGSLRPGEVYDLYTSQPVQVSHSIRARAPNGRNYHSAYALIPPIQSYANSYSFQTHGQRNGQGSDFTYNYVTLVSPREIFADVSEDILIYHHNTETGVNTTYTPSQLGAAWVRVGDSYFVSTIRLPAAGIYYLSNPAIAGFRFGAVYYGLTSTQSGSGASEQPNTAFPLGYDLGSLNNIPKPTLCPRCTTGANCIAPIIHTCACNPCINFDDKCTSSANPTIERTCVGTPDSTGNPFTLMFMQNRPDNTPQRELEVYVTSAASGSRPIRVSTPFLPSTDSCFMNESRTISGFEVSLFTLPNPDCFETIGSGIFTNKAVRVQSDDGADISVYAVNRDMFSADGWVAFPDRGAGTDYYTVSYAPPTYFTEFAVINIQDVAVDITLTYTGRAVPSIAGTQFNLPPGNVLQIQSAGDLTGTRVQSSLPVNVYSGNVRALVKVVEDPTIGDINSGSRDHLVEQLLSVNKWGKLFHIEPIPERIFGDQLKVVAKAEGTSCTLYRRHPNGTVTEEKFTLNRGDYFTRDVISGNTYRLASSVSVLVMQITKSQERGSNIHDPSMITIPPVEQYANRYIFNTPLFSGGSGESKRVYRFRRLLISARDVDRSDIRIIHSGVSTFVSDLGTWVQVPGSNYYNIAVELQEGTSLILHNDLDVSFMCIFYGYDDRESLGFPIGLKMQIIDE